MTIEHCPCLSPLMQPVWSESGCSSRDSQVTGEAATYHTVYNKSINTERLEEVCVGLLTGSERTPGPFPLQRSSWRTRSGENSSSKCAAGLPRECLLHFLLWDKTQHLPKLGNISNSTEKKQANVAISELAIVELNPNNIHSEQERAESIRRLLVIYLLFLQSHVAGKGN